MVKIKSTIFFTMVLLGFMGLKERSSSSQFSEPSRKNAMSKSDLVSGLFTGFGGVRGGPHLSVVVDNELSRPRRRLAIKAASSAAEGAITVVEQLQSHGFC